MTICTLKTEADSKKKNEELESVLNFLKCRCRPCYSRCTLSLRLWHSQTQRNENHANSNLSVCHQVRVSQPWRAEDMCCCFRCESQNRVWLCLVVFVCVCVWFVGGQSGPSCLEHTWCVKAKRDQSNSESSLNHVTNLPVENKRFLLVKIISTAQLESYNRLDVISFGEHITMLNY